MKSLKKNRGKRGITVEKEDAKEALAFGLGMLQFGIIVSLIGGSFVGFYAGLAAALGVSVSMLILLFVIIFFSKLFSSKGGSVVQEIDSFDKLDEIKRVDKKLFKKTKRL